MTTGDRILFFFSALGAFNGLLLGLFLLFTNRKKYPAIYFLGALLVGISLLTSNSVFLYFSEGVPRGYVQIGLVACCFIGPLLYFFLQSAVSPLEKVPRIWLIVLAGIAVVIAGVCLGYPFSAHPRNWIRYVSTGIHIFWGGFVIASARVMAPVLRNVFSPIAPGRPADLWLSLIFGGNALLFLFYFSSRIDIHFFATCMNGAISFSLILYVMATLFFYRKRTEEIFLFLPEKPTARRWEDQDAERWLRKLEQVMAEKAVYRNPDLKLHDLAREVSVSSHQLSALLNEQLGKNFTTYVNEYRVAEACRRMTEQPGYTLEAIGYEAGFNSKSTFFSAFKKINGMTPATYQQSVSQPVRE